MAYLKIRFRRIRFREGSIGAVRSSSRWSSGWVIGSRMGTPYIWGVVLGVILDMGGLAVARILRDAQLPGGRRAGPKGVGPETGSLGAASAKKGRWWLVVGLEVVFV